jgi:hypothetical protein
MCVKSLNTYIQLFFNIITTFVKAFVWPGYEILYANVIELCRLHTQPRSDFVIHLFVFMKLLAGQMFL